MLRVQKAHKNNAIDHGHDAAAAPSHVVASIRSSHDQYLRSFLTQLNDALQQDS
jgi:hypothetical protein